VTSDCVLSTVLLSAVSGGHAFRLVAYKAADLDVKVKDNGYTCIIASSILRTYKEITYSKFKKVTKKRLKKVNVLIMSVAKSRNMLHFSFTKLF